MWIQILKQMWNQRRANAWIWTELLIVIVLLWYAVDLVYNYEGAALQPKGYDTSCVFDLRMGTKPLEMLNEQDNQRAGEDFSYLYRLIADYPGVEDICYYYGSVPYSDDTMFEGYSPHTDSTRVTSCFIRYVSPSYFRVFRLTPIAGELDEKKWSRAEYPQPALMSEELADSLFQVSGADAVGKTCFNPYWLNSSHPETNYRVMAVLPHHKLGDYERYEPFIYLPSHDEPVWWQNVAIRVSPEYVEGFAERFRTDMQQVFDRGIFYLASIRSYADMKTTYDIAQGTVNYLNSAYAVVAFFGFNIFLTVLSIFWFRTRKRRCEIALRMAMGCSRQGIMRHYVAEGLLLLLLAAVPAAVVCLNVWVADLTVHTLMEPTLLRFGFCFAVALALLAVVVWMGVWYPARKAMRVQPAEALHDE